jgi:hypothetical protein
LVVVVGSDAVLGLFGLRPRYSDPLAGRQRGSGISPMITAGIIGIIVLLMLAFLWNLGGVILDW